jgi:hypothetical protein
MKATQQQGTAVVDVQSAILAELRRLNEQVAWQNQAISQLIQEHTSP